MPDPAARGDPAVRPAPALPVHRQTPCYCAAGRLAPPARRALRPRRRRVRHGIVPGTASSLLPRGTGVPCRATYSSQRAGAAVAARNRYVPDRSQVPSSPVRSPRERVADPGAAPRSMAQALRHARTSAAALDAQRQARRNHAVRPLRPPTGRRPPRAREPWKTRSSSRAAPASSAPPSSVTSYAMPRAASSTWTRSRTPATSRRSRKRPARRSTPSSTWTSATRARCGACSEHTGPAPSSTSPPSRTWTARSTGPPASSRPTCSARSTCWRRRASTCARWRPRTATGSASSTSRPTRSTAASARPACSTSARATRPARPTRRARRPRTTSRSRGTAPTACPCCSRTARTTTGRTSSRRNSSRT